MGWLKKFGQTAIKVVGLASGVLPMINGMATAVSAGNTTVTSDLTKIGAVVSTVEVVGQAVTSGLSGPDKLKAAVPLVAQIVQTSELMAGKKIKNETEFTGAVQDYVNATVRLLNALEG